MMSIPLKPRRLKLLVNGRRHRRCFSLAAFFVFVAIVFPQLTQCFVGPKGFTRKGLKGDGDQHDEGAHHHDHHNKGLEWWHLMAQCPGLVALQVVLVMCLCGLFERVEHSLRHRLEHAGDEVGGHILDGLFKEFTGMGFLSLLLFGAIQSGMVDQSAVWLGMEHDHENPVSEAFEMAHMMIFLLLVVMLIQAMLILQISRRVARNWQGYEETRAFGLPDNSMESQFVRSGHLTREPSRNARRGIDLVMNERFTYGSTWLERSRKRRCPIHQLVMWRAFRHEFLFGSNDEDGLVPSPSMFNFNAYLNTQLGHTVLGLVQVSSRVWVLSVLAMCPIMYLCMASKSVQMIQCVFAWTICTAAIAISELVAKDTNLIAPTVPEDPRHVCLLFVGTNSLTMRAKRRRSCEYDKTGSLPQCVTGLGDCQLDNKLITLGPPEASVCANTRKVGNSLVSLMAYKESVGFIGMWQAMLITSLIVSGLSMTRRTWWQVALEIITWAEWPIMMGFVVPDLLQRLTIMNSVGCRANKDLIRRVTLDSKEGLLSYQMRLVQMASFAQHVATPSRGDIGQREKQKFFKTGMRLCQEATPGKRHGFAQLFTTWDADNNGSVDSDELMKHCVHLVRGGNTNEAAMDMAKDLVNYVDHDGTGELNFDKCCALVALATSADYQQTVKEDLLGTFFPLIDDDGNGYVTMDEFTEWLRKMSDGVENEDIANLVFKHFGTGKPSLLPDDFVDFMMHLDGSHHHH